MPVTASDVAFTFNYINENQLLNLAVYTDGITKAVAVDDTTVQITTGPQGQHAQDGRADPARAHLEQDRRQGRRGNSYQNPPPIVGTGPFQIVEWQKGKFVQARRPTRTTGAARLRSTSSSSSSTRTPTRWRSDLKLGTIDGAIDVPLAQFESLGNEPGLDANKATSLAFTELGMNCYDSPDSKGNPVLLDKQFRQAVNWAVDREKVVVGGRAGLRHRGLQPHRPVLEVPLGAAGRRALHLRPGEGEADARRGRLQGRERRRLPRDQGRQEAVLRFYATADSPENQTAGKLIVDWLRDVGIKLEFQVVDAGALIDAQYNYEGDTYAPDWDMFIWYWTQDVDPQFMLSIYTPQQIEGWNDCLWTDPEYTKLNDAAVADHRRDGAQADHRRRCSRSSTSGAAYAILTYPYQLEAYNTDKWQGWVHVPGDAGGEQQGAVLYSYNNIDTYRFVEPKTATESTATAVESTT